MDICKVNNEELFNVMQHVNLVRVKFGSSETWMAVPVLYSSTESVDLIVDFKNISQDIIVGDQTVFKIQRLGFEYLVSGEVSEKCESNCHTLTVGYSSAQKYYNKRKSMRFDTDLRTIIGSQNCKDSIVKNISKGGALIFADTDVENDSVIDVNITFESGNCFSSKAKVLRKSFYNNCYNYGIQFVDVSDENNLIIDREIAKYERAYLRSLDVLKNFESKSDVYFDKRIAIFSYDIDDSNEIKEVLVKIGADNFDVFHNFKYYVDFFLDESPEIIIIDTQEINENIEGIIKDINDSFPNINIILLLPLENFVADENEKSICSLVSILYKPLVYDELEQVLIKYL